MIMFVISNNVVSSPKHIWIHQKQVSQAGISNYIPQFTVGCGYLSLPEIPASGAKVIIYAEEHTPDIVSTEPADFLELLSARASAGTAITNFGSYIKGRYRKY